MVFLITYKTATSKFSSPTKPEFLRQNFLWPGLFQHSFGLYSSYSLMPFPSVNALLHVHPWEEVRSMFRLLILFKRIIFFISSSFLFLENNLLSISKYVLFRVQHNIETSFEGQGFFLYLEMVFLACRLFKTWRFPGWSHMWEEKLLGNSTCNRLSLEHCLFSVFAERGGSFQVHVQ